MVGPDITFTSSGIKSEEIAQQNIPTRGWLYADGTCGHACWFPDSDLTFKQVK